MIEKINSASRILKITQKAISIGNNQNLIETWSKVFGVVEERPSIKALKVTRLLNKLNDEIHLLNEYLTHQDQIPEKLYGHTIQFLEEAVSTQNLTQPWHVAGQYLNDRTLTSLEYLAELLPTEEAMIPQESLETLLDLLKELEEMLKQSTLNHSLIMLIEQQIETIRVAVMNYGVSGVSSLKAAATTMYGEIILNKETLSSHPNAEVKKLSEVWDKLVEVVDKGQPTKTKLSIAFNRSQVFGTLSLKN